MQTTAKSLGIDRLSLAERILLVEEIWDSIAPRQKRLRSHSPIRRNSTAA
jgi:putative addiction module component (TIGR02574 family)